MKFVTRFWATVSYLGSILTLTPVNNVSNNQSLLLSNAGSLVNEGPIFVPPGHSEDPPAGIPGPYLDFKCNYSAMVDYEFCGNITDGGSRRCWLRPKEGLNHPNPKFYNIETDYEVEAPIGIVREYHIDLEDSYWVADGINFTTAKLMKWHDSVEDELKYPGPWIQACWGDTVKVTFYNKLKYNGTSIHWHGVRMHNNFLMDGVNGVTQCPIAPGDTFTYTFNVSQYGTSWYHSHYSLQYADGILGPLTFYGPSSEEFDRAIDPLVITDWYHASAFWVATQNFDKVYSIAKPSILINGHGDVRRLGYNNTSKVEPFHKVVFDSLPPAPSRQDAPKKYLLRIINTAFDTTFIFSIDHHYLQVIQADFVPIYSYMTSSILVGIGQRYNVIVEGKPIPYADRPVPTEPNFWIRTSVAKCFKNNEKDFPSGYERAAILTYDVENNKQPDSTAWPNVKSHCADEASWDLIPIHKWDIPEKPVNTENGLEKFDIVGQPTKYHTKEGYPLAVFALERDRQHWNPMRVDYSDPIVKHLDKDPKSFAKALAVVPANYTEKDWVFLVIDGTKKTSYKAHPFHLHGHDFALLQTSTIPWDDEKLESYNPNFKNPPRRDVVLLPNMGFIVIAFKTDNPGSWLMHCHIAAHASEGLGFQILERQQDAAKEFLAKPSPGYDQVMRGCKNWEGWQRNKDNWFNRTLFQDDSGI